MPVTVDLSVSTQTSQPKILSLKITSTVCRYYVQVKLECVPLTDYQTPRGFIASHHCCAPREQ